jgi:hypothetical protein
MYMYLYLHTISCLQNTLIIIVCKQTSALHIINPRIYHILRRHVFFINLFYKNIYKRKKIHSEKNCQTKNPPDSDPDLNSSSLVRSA